MAIGLFFDTETTGIANFRAPTVDPSQPKLVQLGALLTDLDDRKDIACLDVIIYPESWEIPNEAALIHGITTGMAKKYGVGLDNAVLTFRDMMDRADVIIAHNIKFDKLVMDRACAMVAVAYDRDVDEPFKDKPYVCTMLAATPVLKLRSARPQHGNDYKWPKLEQCSQFFFKKTIEGAHSALVDTRVARDVYFELVDRGVVPRT